MLYTPLPKSKYKIKVGSKFHGLGTLSCSSELWNLLTISSRLPFNWERPGTPTMSLPASFPNLNEAEMTLLQMIGGVRVNRLVATLNPIEFYEHLVEHNASHCHLAKYWRGQKDWKKVVRGRALAWKAASGTMLDKKEMFFMEMIVPGFEDTRRKYKRNK